MEVASSSLVARSTNQERNHAFLFSIWYRSQVVRPRSAKPLFASSNLAGTSKTKRTSERMSIFLIVSRKQRPEPKRVRIFLGGTGQICLHFHSNWNENKCVTAIQLAVSRCPPDICILSFKSVATISLKQKRPVETGRFVLEVPARFELANNGFADRGLTTWLRYHMKEGTLFTFLPLERVTRLELATSTLARWRSTG